MLDYVSKYYTFNFLDARVSRHHIRNHYKPLAAMGNMIQAGRSSTQVNMADMADMGTIPGKDQEANRNQSVSPLTANGNPVGPVHETSNLAEPNRSGIIPPPNGNNPVDLIHKQGQNLQNIQTTDHPSNPFSKPIQNHVLDSGSTKQSSPVESLKDILSTIDIPESILKTKITSLVLSAEENDMTISDVLQKVVEQNKSSGKLPRQTKSIEVCRNTHEQEPTNETTNSVQVTSNDIETNDQLCKEKEYSELKRLLDINRAGHSTQQSPIGDINGASNHFPTGPSANNSTGFQNGAIHNRNDSWLNNYRPYMAPPNGVKPVINGTNSYYQNVHVNSSSYSSSRNIVNPDWPSGNKDLQNGSIELHTVSNPEFSRNSSSYDLVTIDRQLNQCSAAVHHSNELEHLRYLSESVDYGRSSNNSVNGNVKSPGLSSFSDDSLDLSRKSRSGSCRPISSSVSVAPRIIHETNEELHIQQLNQCIEQTHPYPNGSQQGPTSVNSLFLSPSSKRNELSVQGNNTLSPSFQNNGVNVELETGYNTITSPFTKENSFAAALSGPMSNEKYQRPAIENCKEPVTTEKSESTKEVRAFLKRILEDKLDEIPTKQVKPTPHIPHLSKYDNSCNAMTENNRDVRKLSFPSKKLIRKLLLSSIANEMESQIKKPYRSNKQTNQALKSAPFDCSVYNVDENDDDNNGDVLDLTNRDADVTIIAEEGGALDLTLNKTSGIPNPNWSQESQSKQTNGNSVRSVITQNIPRSTETNEQTTHNSNIAEVPMNPVSALLPTVLFDPPNNETQLSKRDNRTLQRVRNPTNEIRPHPILVNSDSSRYPGPAHFQHSPTCCRLRNQHCSQWYHQLPTRTDPAGVNVPCRNNIPHMYHHMQRPTFIDQRRYQGGLHQNGTGPGARVPYQHSKVPVSASFPAPAPTLPHGPPGAAAGRYYAPRPGFNFAPGPSTAPAAGSFIRSLLTNPPGSNQKRRSYFNTRASPLQNQPEHNVLTEYLPKGSGPSAFSAEQHLYSTSEPQTTPNSTPESRNTPEYQNPPDFNNAQNSQNPKDSQNGPDSQNTPDFENVPVNTNSRRSFSMDAIGTNKRSDEQLANGKSGLDVIHSIIDAFFQVGDEKEDTEKEICQIS